MSKIFLILILTLERKFTKQTVYIAMNIDQDADLDTLPVPRVASV